MFACSCACFSGGGAVLKTNFCFFDGAAGRRNITSAFRFDDLGSTVQPLAWRLLTTLSKQINFTKTANQFGLHERKQAIVVEHALSTAQFEIIEGWTLHGTANGFDCAHRAVARHRGIWQYMCRRRGIVQQFTHLSCPKTSICRWTILLGRLWFWGPCNFHGGRFRRRGINFITALGPGYGLGQLYICKK